MIEASPVNLDEQVRRQITSRIQSPGLVETLPWSRLPAIPEKERAHLAELLSVGDPLSETIITDRGQPAVYFALYQQEKSQGIP